MGLGLELGLEVESRVRVHPGVGAAAVQALHNLVFADPGAVYTRTGSFILLLKLGARPSPPY